MGRVGAAVGGAARGLQGGCGASRPMMGWVGFAEPFLLHDVPWDIIGRPLRRVDFNDLPMRS